MDLRIIHPVHHALPVPSGAVGPERAAAWAAETARAHATATASGASPALAARIERALTDLAGRADDTSALMLAVSADGHALAPLRITVSDEAVSREGQAELLWSRAAVLPPTAQEQATAHLGTGFSVTLVEADGDTVFATRRWLFLGEDAAVAVLLGPVAPLALALVEEVAERVLEDTRIDGFRPSADRARIDELLAAAERGGEAWAL